MKWEQILKSDKITLTCDEAIEKCTSQAEWKLMFPNPNDPDYGFIRAVRCGKHIPAYVNDLKLSFYEMIFKKAPPHRHFAETGCCNPLCGGSWGTNCWCCHHGKYALDMEEEEMLKIMAPHDVHDR